ncbi:hypothetical protein OCU04_008916 [Sclerotinia nivalis]|uniref:VWFA domain-containing protein n=1 Tax=Sclerotinia nivalis TaxID=352851 RepID=A0A9X0DI00_9HELO|nr:hypothetical protein OCU04_008916 [Sclerotinia nivalis]
MNRASTTLLHITAGLEKDFILAIYSDDDIGTPYALLETHPTIPNHRAQGVSFITQFSPPDSPPPSPSEIVFVAECDSHMRDDIPMLISALKIFLKSLPTNVKFNIRSFRTKIDFLWPQSKDYSSETLQEVMQHIATFDASYGGMENSRQLKLLLKVDYLRYHWKSFLLLMPASRWRKHKETFESFALELVMPFYLR